MRKWIGALSGLNVRVGWHRAITFGHFEKIEVYHRIVVTPGRYGDAGDVIIKKYKGQMRNCIRAARSLRMSGGNPLVFSDYKHTFWSDPSTKYIPDDQIDLAEKEITFHPLTMRITQREFYGIMNFEQRRGHSGRWTGVSNDADLKDETSSPHKFYFESPTDYIEFRMRYEHEIVE